MTTTLTPPTTLHGATLDDAALDHTAPATPDYDVIRQSAGIVDYTGAGLFQLTGPGAGALISTVTTRSVDFLLEGQSQQALILDDQGSIVSDVVVHGLGDGFLLQIWPDQTPAVRTLLTTAAAANAGVELTDLSAEKSVTGVEGPTSFTVVGHYVDFPISSLAYKSWASVGWRGHDLMVSRTGITGEYGYLVIAPPTATGELRDDLAGHGAQPVSRAAVDTCRMEMRFPNLEAELPADGATPFELGLAWMADFSGDFTGKDALLARESEVDLPVCWRGKVGDRAVPAAGSLLEVSDAVVGRVLHAVYSPTLDRCVGTALVDTGCAATGLSFRIGAADVETVSAPFLIATSFTTSMD